MNDRSNAMGCVMGCWLAALAAGILLAVMLMMFGGFSFTPAAFFGLLLFVLGGAFLSWAICKGSSSSAVLGASAAGAGAAAVSAASAPTSSTSASADADAGAAAATATAAPLASSDATVKSGTTLSGEEELAARKGDWKYEGEAAKPAKKPAANKTTAKAAPAKKAPAKKAAASKPAAKAKAKPVAKDGKPELLKKARAGGPDDLKQIKGVGPKMEGMLHTMGVFHFDQVASWRKAEVQWVDDNLEGFKGRVSRDEWVKQAKILAKGGTTEFSKKVDKGGVY